LQGFDYCVSHKNGTVSMVDRYLRIRSNLELHSQEVRSVEYSNALSRYATASFDGQICLFDEAG
jgi:WD40 repeat protein